MTAPKPLVFDGHNDLLSKIFNEGGTARVASFFEGREGAIDLKKAEVGGFGGGFGDLRFQRLRIGGYGVCGVSGLSGTNLTKRRIKRLEISSFCSKTKLSENSHLMSRTYILPVCVVPLTNQAHAIPLCSNTSRAAVENHSSNLPHHSV